MYQTKEKTRENIAITNALIKQNEKLIKQLKETNKQLCAECDNWMRDLEYLEKVL
mgnify:CR=1 FL=1